MKLKPVEGHLVIKQIKLEPKNKGTIITVTKEVSAENVGQVIEVGPVGRDYKVGSKVIYNKPGVKIKIGVEEFMVLPLENVVATVED